MIDEEHTRIAPNSPAQLQESGAITMPTRQDQTEAVSKPVLLNTNPPLDSQLSPNATLFVSPVQSFAPLNIGHVLKGRFEIIELLGEGGMGQVFKALDARKMEAKSRNPYVAIKVLSPGLAKNATLIAGLQRECEKAQELSHPNIITVYDFDRDGDYVFMSMEYLSGQPLAKIIRESMGSGGIELGLAWPIIRQMGEALAYAHRKNIVHSDFKPANVFITDNNDVKVLDFGIAARLGLSDADETIFDARAEGGLTPPYASFEMLNGSGADPRDDIYAFGLVVYELLSGRHPYARKTAAAIFLEQRNNQFAMPNPIAGLTRKQSQLLKSCIEILQEQRPKQLDDWLQQFRPQPRSLLKYWLSAGSFFSFLTLAGIAFLEWPTQNIETKPLENKLKEVDDTKTAQPESTNKPSYPQANPGPEQQVSLGEKVVLDARGSVAPDNGPLQYAWRFVAQPDGSRSQLYGTDRAELEFIPDQPGKYILELVVSDTNHVASLPATVSIMVNPAAKPSLLSETESADGIVHLASSKSRYVIGEGFELDFQVKRKGYLRIAYLSSSGEIGELLPNKYQSAKVEPGKTYHLPPKADSFKMLVTGPTGMDKIVAVFSLTPHAKVKNMVNSDGTLVNEMQKLANSTAIIQFQVLNP